VFVKYLSTSFSVKKKRNGINTAKKIINTNINAIANGVPNINPTVKFIILLIF